jgi:Tubulin/FtsZ family, GTPase domain
MDFTIEDICPKAAMSINLKIPDIRELKPRITVFGVGGAGGNAVNNMISAGLQGVDFVVANTDAQALTTSRAERIIQMGVQATEGLGAGSQPDGGRAAAEEVIDEIRDHLTGAHMVFVTAGMGGGTGTGASPVVARAARAWRTARRRASGRTPPDLAAAPRRGRARAPGGGPETRWPFRRTRQGTTKGISRLLTRLLATQNAAIGERGGQVP